MALKQFPGTYAQYMKLPSYERRLYKAPKRPAPPTPTPTLIEQLRETERKAKQKLPYKKIEPEAKEAYVEHAKAKVVKEYVEPQLPRGAEITKVTPTERGYQIQYVVPKLAPTLERKRVSMMGEALRRPTALGVLPTQITKVLRQPFEEKGVTVTLLAGIEQVWSHEKRYPFARLPPSVAEIQRAGKAGAEFMVAPVGFVESFVRPDVPTVPGAVFERVFYGTTTQAEFLAKHRGYAAGEALMEYLFGKHVVAPAIGKLKGVGEKVYKFGHEKVGLKLPAWAQKRLWPIEFGRRQIERGITWGEQKFLLPRGHELSESMAKYWKYTGYPAIHGPKAGYGVIQVTKPTAWVQLQHAIERGVFPRMGGLAAQQALVTERAVTPTSFTSKLQAFARTGLTAPAKVTTRVVPFVRPFEREREKFKPLTLQVPKVKERKKLIPLLKPAFTPFERAIEKFKPLTLERAKAKQRQLPRLLQITKQVPRQIQMLPSPPQVLDIPAPRVPFLFRPPEAMFGRRKRDLFGGWFLKKHPLPTGAELSRRLLGKPRKRRKGGRKKLWYVV